MPFASSPTPRKVNAVSKNSLHTGQGTVLASTAALASAVAASSCCLPVLPFAAAAGLAGSSAWFTAVRPYLLLASVVLIGFAFFQSHCANDHAFSSACACWRSSPALATTSMPAALFQPVSSRLRGLMR